MAREHPEAAAMSDMLQAAETVLRHVGANSRGDYEIDDLLRHAVERNIESRTAAVRGIPRQTSACVLAGDHGDAPHTGP